MDCRSSWFLSIVGPCTSPPHCTAELGEGDPDRPPPPRPRAGWERSSCRVSSASRPPATASSSPTSRAAAAHPSRRVDADRPRGRRPGRSPRRSNCATGRSTATRSAATSPRQHLVSVPGRRRPADPGLHRRRRGGPDRVRPARRRLPDEVAARSAPPSTTRRTVADAGGVPRGLARPAAAVRRHRHLGDARRRPLPARGPSRARLGRPARAAGARRAPSSPVLAIGGTRDRLMPAARSRSRIADTAPQRRAAAGRRRALPVRRGPGGLLGPRSPDWLSRTTLNALFSSSASSTCERGSATASIGRPGERTSRRRGAGVITVTGVCGAEPDDLDRARPGRPSTQEVDRERARRLAAAVEDHADVGAVLERGRCARRGPAARRAACRPARSPARCAASSRAGRASGSRRPPGSSRARAGPATVLSYVYLPTFGGRGDPLAEVRRVDLAPARRVRRRRPAA